MFLSTFELFKIGIGPSSSHTMGPMIAAKRFVDEVVAGGVVGLGLRVTATLHGSLAFTGKGHATDRAICLGLLGEVPSELDPDSADRRIEALHSSKHFAIGPSDIVWFDPDNDIVFDYGPALPGHANGMVFRALDPQGQCLLEKTYYSIGGGFVVSKIELKAELASEANPTLPNVPFPFSTAAEMLEMGAASGLSIAAMKRANETALLRGEDLDPGLDQIWQAMAASIQRGLRAEGVLPGGLGLRRRAARMYRKLRESEQTPLKLPHAGLDWLLAFAMAVNEENAAGGRIVTAPTNGAAGVIPAVLKYYVDLCPGSKTSGVHDFLLTAAAIGGLIKHNASISGAELGCQGEVGSASAMAAAGLCAVLGGTNAQIENAAEIALEHHLGLTCDPVAGLVQVPCIERNGLGAVKAVSACSLALHGDGTHFMPLDNCIAAMWATGQDMNDKYKETSRGGLAVSLPAC